MFAGKYRVSGMKFNNLNIIGAKVNGDIVFDDTDIEGTFILEYTIRAKHSTDTINSIYYLPRIYTDEKTNTIDGFQKIRITKKNGTVTTNLETLASEVDTIKMWISQNAYSVKFYPGVLNLPSDGHGVTSVKQIDVSNFSDTSHLFCNCPRLTNIDGISDWDVSNIENMDSMFYNCPLLEELDLSKWDVSNVTNMESMFYDCKALVNLNISTWNVENISSMSSMFSGCESLVTLDISTWNVQSVYSMRAMFTSCKSLKTIDISNWDVHINDAGYMFAWCNSLESLDLSGWDIEYLRVMDRMFHDCLKLTSLNLSTWDTSDILESEYMFNNLPENIDWCYDGTNYENWTLSEDDTGFSGSFPWGE